MLVAFAAAPPARRQRKAVRLAEVGQQALAFRPFGKNQGAHGQAQHQIRPLFAVAVAALAGLAVLGLIQALQTEIIEGKQTVVGPQIDGTALPAVAAVRAAARHKLLAPEGHAAVAALARPDLNFRFIHKSHTILPLTGASRPRIYVIQTR